MFTKEKEIGRGGFKVTETVIDWEAIWGWIVVGGIALFLLKSCGG